MTRRLAGALVLVCVLFAALVPGSSAEAPPGPRLAVVKLRDPEWTELSTVDPQGGTRQTLYALSAFKANRAVYPFSAPSWSPDGSQIAFTTLNTEIRAKFGESTTMLALISADGGAVRSVRGTAGGFDAVFSPDGRSIAFAKEIVRRRPGSRDSFESIAIWLADLETGESKQLTPWRNDVFLFPSSFSPDGSRLALSRAAVGESPSAVEIGLDGTQVRVLARNAYEPVYSPDGQSIAFLRGPVREKTRHFPNGSLQFVDARMTDIFVRSSLDGAVGQVTHTKAVAEEAPRWDPSGRRLAYTEWRPFGSPSESPYRAEALAMGLIKDVRVINVNGTCSTKILSGGIALYYAAVWQPGAGREAGPISC